MQYASLRNIDTKAVRGELITLALASLLADASERVAVLGTGQRPITGRVAVRRVAETLFDETRDPERKLASLPPLVPLPAHGTVVLVSDWLDPLDQIEAVIRALCRAPACAAIWCRCSIRRKKICRSTAM